MWYGRYTNCRYAQRCFVGDRVKVRFKTRVAGSKKLGCRINQEEKEKTKKGGKEGDKKNQIEEGGGGGGIEEKEDVINYYNYYYSKLTN